MKATRNPAVTKEVSQIKVVEVVETMEVSPESFTLSLSTQKPCNSFKALSGQPVSTADKGYLV